MFILDVLEALFILVMLGIILLLLLCFSFSWSWAQQRPEIQIRWVDLISAAAVEWGAMISLAATQLRKTRSFYEAPPLQESEASPQQIPVLFIPSLHTRSSIYSLLIWRLKRNFWNSLWVFDWKVFMQDPVLMEDHLKRFVDEVIKRTEARRFRIVSFGSSRPIISKVLNREDLRAYCDKWIAISSAAELSSFFKFISSSRVRQVYEGKIDELKNPDLVICGECDFFCFPPSVFGDSRKIMLSNVGHYSSLLHSDTTQAVMKELAS